MTTVMLEVICDADNRCANALLHNSDILREGVCVAGLIYKVWTSWESQRVTLSLQKESRDWTIRRGFAEPTSTESIFMDLAFGAFTLVTFCLLVGHVLGDPRTIAEKLLMVTGFITMVIVGGLLIISVDDMPDRLYDNAIILGVLAFLAAVLFLADAGTKCANKKRSPRPVVVVPKREVEIVPRQQPPPPPVPEETAVQPKKEETKEETTQTQNGIKSVEIRIKDPSKNWPVYGGRPKALSSEIESLAEAERVDRLLQHAPDVTDGQEPGGLLHGRKSTATVHPTPAKHTSSFYIGGPFSWRRLNNSNTEPNK